MGWSGRRDNLVDLVHEKATPPQAGIGGQRSGAGLPAGLVAEKHGPAVLPAERVGTDQSLFAVVGEADRAPLAYSGFQGRPSHRGDGMAVTAVRGVGVEAEQVVEAPPGGSISVSMRRARGRPRSPW